MKIMLKKSGCERLIKAIDAYIQKVDDELLEALTEAGYSNPKQTMKDLEAFTKEIKKLLEEDTKAIINEIYDYDSVQDFIVQRWPELKNSKDLVEKLTTTVSMKLGEVIPEYVADYISRTDPALSYIGLTHKTTAWITSWSGKLAEMMKLTDNKTIERILNDALKNGRSVAETAKRIGDSGERDSGYRSRRTATTELLRAHSVAQQESFMQSPAVVSKMWRHSGWRQYSRQNHIDMDGQTVRKEDPFVLVGEEGIFYPMYPRDESLPAGESINCGCIAEPIVDERYYEMSEEDRRRMQEAEVNRMNAEYEFQNGKQMVTNYTSGGTIRTRGTSSSGGRILDPESDDAKAWAKSYYREIRAKGTDTKKISDRLGIPKEDVDKIKKYLFSEGTYYNEALKMEVPFDPDAAIGQSWQRLAEGKEILPHDRTLINHELLEMKLREEHPDWSQYEAHCEAQRTFDYQKESDDYYGSLRQRKKN